MNLSGELYRRADDPRQRQHINVASPAALQNAGTGLDRRPGRQHIVDQQDRLARDLGQPARVDVEGLPDIAPPFMGAKPAL